MNATYILLLIAGYFLVLIGISYFTGKNSSNETFFKANKQSPWYLVAFGMIGASLSGVTFISVPGAVEAKQWGYLQVVLGYLVGYLIIAYVLLPLYYRLNLTSIYEYLQQRFGKISYKTGAIAFLISRTVGAAFRLFLVANVLQLLIFDSLGVPFEATVVLTIALIYVYTHRGGIKTIVWTDTLQTLFMLVSVVITLIFLSRAMNIDSVSELTQYVKSNTLSKTFMFDNVNDGQYFWKAFLSGIFITITMTGLDQDMMQKNLTCRSLKDAQKNMIVFSVVLVAVNILFLALGILLVDYATQAGITASKDDLFPTIAMLPEVGLFTSSIFILGLIAAAYSSADSALTALTTSVCIDILDFSRFRDRVSPSALAVAQSKQKQTRKLVHLGVSGTLVLIIILFKYLFTDVSVIWELFKAAGYTYGPLLGLYSFGLFTERGVHDRWVWLVAILAPLFSYVLNMYSTVWFNGYQIGFEILIINGILMFIGLLVISHRKHDQGTSNLHLDTSRS